MANSCGDAIAFQNMAAVDLSVNYMLGKGKQYGGASYLDCCLLKSDVKELMLGDFIAKRDISEPEKQRLRASLTTHADYRRSFQEDVSWLSGLSKAAKTIALLIADAYFFAIRNLITFHQQMSFGP